MYRYVKKHRINVTIVISIYWAESDLKKECVLKSGQGTAVENRKKKLGKFYFQRNFFFF